MENAAQRRVDMAFERGAGAERDHRHMLRRADAHNPCTSSVVCENTTASGGSLATRWSCCRAARAPLATSREWLPSARRALPAWRRSAWDLPWGRDFTADGRSACGIDGPFLGKPTLAIPEAASSACGARGLSVSSKSATFFQS